MTIPSDKVNAPHDGSWSINCYYWLAFYARHSRYILLKYDRLAGTDDDKADYCKTL